MRKGRWQRAILAELHKRRAFYVRDLLPSAHSRAQYVALLRAADSLASRGLVNLRRYQCWGGGEKAQVAVSRRGVEFDRHELRKR